MYGAQVALQQRVIAAAFLQHLQQIGAVAAL